MTYPHVTTREEFLGAEVASFNVRGRTVDEVRAFVDRLDARLLAIHDAATSERREKTPAEQDAFDHGLRLRDEALARIEYVQRCEDQIRRGPNTLRAGLLRCRWLGCPGRRSCQRRGPNE
jgi:hypothetical protein